MAQGNGAPVATSNAVDGDTLAWLLEPSSPGARYLALRDLVDTPKPAELRAARKAAHEKGPIAAILRNMSQDGYWIRTGAGYNPKYRSAVWSLLTLAQLGASVDDDPRIGEACAYLLDHGLAEGGQFTTTKIRRTVWHRRLPSRKHVLGAARAGLRRSAS